MSYRCYIISRTTEYFIPRKHVEESSGRGGVEDNEGNFIQTYKFLGT